MKKALYIILLSSVGYAQKGSLPRVLATWEKNPEKSELIDFSYAGYHTGKELPTRQYAAQGRKYYDVTDFGAIPNDGKDDIDAIQRAVDEAGKNGGGVVKFPAGVFDFDVNTEKRFVKIPYSNVVLSGYGENVDGTILYDHTPSDYHDHSKKWLAGMYPSFFKISPYAGDTAEYSPLKENKNKLTAILKGKRGSKQLIVASVERLQIGHTYFVTQKLKDTTLVAEIVYPLPKQKISSGHLYKDEDGDFTGYKYQTMITITGIQGNILTLDAPLIWELKAEHEPCIWQIPGLITESGIENFTLRTAWSEEFYHHKNPIHDNGWDGIKINFAANCWVRTIRFENVSTAIGALSVKNCVFYDCRITGNAGHNGFVIGGASTYSLFMRLQGGRQMHTYSLNGYISGNVFTKCFSEEPSSIDSHGTLGISNLFDNIYGCVMRSGGNSTVNSPLHGRGLVLWNFAFGMLNPYNHRIVDDICSIKQYPGLIAVGVYSIYRQPIYFKGENDQKVNTDRYDKWAIIESHNKPMNIPSLYEYQRKKRLGSELPD